MKQQTKPMALQRSFSDVSRHVRVPVSFQDVVSGNVNHCDFIVLQNNRLTEEIAACNFADESSNA